jgi:hypothetical protein
MRGKPLGFVDDEPSRPRKRTKRERFLAEREVVVPWTVDRSDGTPGGSRAA